ADRAQCVACEIPIPSDLPTPFQPGDQRKRWPCTPVPNGYVRVNRCELVRGQPSERTRDPWISMSGVGAGSTHPASGSVVVQDFGHRRDRLAEVDAAEVQDRLFEPDIEGL